MCDYPNNERYLKSPKNTIIGAFLLLVSCNFFEAKQQVFECKKTHMDGQPLKKGSQVINYFHFNDDRLDVSLGPVGIGLSGYSCQKTEFVYTCSDLKKDNFDDQITLDRFTLAAQQVVRSSEKTAIIDYQCLKLDRLVE
tara:strand:+ start:36 stop:452 length:417 start_codon:yes stop_codon:yes gene_type:complete